MARKVKWIVGHVYSVDWNDHYSARGEEESQVRTTPFICRSYGRLVRDTKDQVVLEHDRHLSDPGSQRIEYHARLKSDIVRVVDYGKSK